MSKKSNKKTEKNSSLNSKSSTGKVYGGKTFFGAKLSTLIVVALILLIVAVILISFLINLNKDNENVAVNENAIAVGFYFVNDTTNEWEREVHNITKGSSTKVLTEVLDTLYKGPKSTSLEKSIPDGVEITSVKLVDNDTAEIQFSESYKDLSPAQDLMLRGSLTHTLTELDFVKNVHFYVGDAELLTSSGKPIGDMNRQNTLLVTNSIGVESAEKQTVKLYFANEQAEMLIGEEREISFDPSQDLEPYIVKSLIDGPKTKGLYPTLPAEAKFRTVKTEDGICYVDFTSDFLNKFSGGSAGETMFVFSLVNSLTERTSVKKVQILFDGNRITDQTNFNMDLSKPIERDESFILEP